MFRCGLFSVSLGWQVYRDFLASDAESLAELLAVRFPGAHGSDLQTSPKTAPCRLRSYSRSVPTLPVLVSLRKRLKELLVFCSLFRGPSTSSPLCCEF